MAERHIFFILLSTEVATVNFEDPVSDFYPKYNFLFDWVFFCCWVVFVVIGVFFTPGICLESLVWIKVTLQVPYLSRSEFRDIPLVPLASVHMCTTVNDMKKIWPLIWKRLFMHFHKGQKSYNFGSTQKWDTNMLVKSPKFSKCRWAQIKKAVINFLWPQAEIPF